MHTEVQFYEKILTWFTGLFVVAEDDTHYHLREKDERGFFWETPIKRPKALCGKQVNKDTLIKPEAFGNTDAVMKKWCPNCSGKHKIG